jgi:DNA-binding transcriptional ArsR family regulator
MRSIKAEKNRRIRIAILELLKTSYPGSLDLKVLQFSLDNLGYPMPPENLSAHLTYLEEKKYVRLELRKGYGFEIAFASLTADGWDLLDGHSHEKGIDEAL